LAIPTGADDTAMDMRRCGLVDRHWLAYGANGDPGACYIIYRCVDTFGSSKARPTKQRQTVLPSGGKANAKCKIFQP
jgi:hypothetical protein